MFIALGTAAAAAIAFGAGYLVGRRAPDDSAPVIDPIHAANPAVRDAMRRWAAKDGLSIERAMRGRSVELMYFPSKLCVQFQLRDFDVGGVPVYCYRLDARAAPPYATTDLVEEYSDVE